MLKANRFLAIIVLFFFAVIMGSCGSGGHTPPRPPVSVSISYPQDGSLIGGGTGVTTVEGSVSSCLSGEKIQLLIDSVPSVLVDCSSNFSLDFNASGMATGLHTLTVQAPTASTSITVKVDPAELRKQALQFLTTYNTFGYFSGVRRWASLPIVLEVSSEIVQDGYLSAYQEAANFWNKYTGITFNVIPSTESQVDPMTGKLGVVFFEYGTPSGTSASTWTNVDMNTLAHIASIVTIGPGCGDSKILMAHEIGHSLGIWAEVNDGTITDHLILSWRMNPVTAEAMKILYFELAPGSPVPAT